MCEFCIKFVVGLVGFVPSVGIDIEYRIVKGVVICMYMDVYACMYVCMCICMYMLIGMCMCICMCMCMCVCVCVCVYVLCFMYVCLCVVYVYVHSYSGVFRSCYNHYYLFFDFSVYVALFRLCFCCIRLTSSQVHKQFDYQLTFRNRC